MDRYMLFPSGMGQHQNGSYVLFADAQATITALQDERDGWVRSREHYYQLWMRATDERDEMRKERDEFESLLTQRTAELNEIEKIVDIDSGKTLIEKVRDLKHSFKQVYDSYQDAANEMFKAQDERTAELEAANDKVQFLEKKNRNLLDSENLTLKVKADQDVRLASLQAELERVRGDVNTLNQLLRDKGLGQGEIDGMAADLEELTALRTLIAALPKVEGEIMVSESLVLAEDPDMCSDMSDKEEAVAYAALLKHRQGME